MNIPGAASATLVVLLAFSSAHGEPEHEAARDGDTQTLRVLVDSGVNVNSRDNYGKTPLHWARDQETAELLIAYGADIDARDEYGHTPLHDADNAAVVNTLIAHGAEVNVTDISGDTPLHQVIKFLWYTGRSELVPVIEELLAHGADCDARDDDGRTALHYAGSVALARLLIDHGADVNARDNEGLKPWDVVRRRWANKKVREIELLTLLSDAGGHGLRPIRAIVIPVLASGLAATLLLVGFLRLKTR